MQPTGLIVAALLSARAVSAALQAVGCYSSIDTSVLEGYGQYETQSLCASRCGSQYPYVAIQNGGNCFCLSSLPSENLILNSECNVPCNGFGSVMCGGRNAYSVFDGLGRDSEHSQSVSSFPSASSSKRLSSTSKQLSNITTPPTHSGSAIVAATSDANGSISYRTVTATSSSSTAPNSSLKLGSDSKSSSKADVGVIAGGVVGGVVALILIIIAVFFFLRRRNLSDDEDDEDFCEKGGNSGADSSSCTIKKPGKFNKSVFDRPMSNPFVHPSDESADKRASRSDLTDPRLNPVMMGRRRLSEGSLADEADYSRKILAVANP